MHLKRFTRTGLHWKLVPVKPQELVALCVILPNVVHFNRVLKLLHILQRITGSQILQFYSQNVELLFVTAANTTNQRTLRKGAIHCFTDVKQYQLLTELETFWSAVTISLQ